MLHIIYPYRERDLKRILLSLQSLKEQTIEDFEVHFIDYGSSIAHGKNVNALISKFTFASYSYFYTQEQPWNKSKALNSIIKKLDSGYLFVADVDMIFHPKFVETAIELAKTKEIWYFKVGFLDEKESKEIKGFETYNIKFTSEQEATGLTLCPVAAAKEIRGFNEFYHFWGSEDTDFHVRLTNAGYKVNFFEKDILMLHQWHVIYRNQETKKLSQKLQIKGIVQFNQYYLKQTIKNKSVSINNDNWGKIQTKEDYLDLNSIPKSNTQIICLSKIEIDYFLFQILPNLLGRHCFLFKNSETKQTINNKAKRILKKSKKEYYSIKEVNDMILFHVISFYNIYPYSFKVSNNEDSICFSIKK